MKKILISWYAYNNDFMRETFGGKSRNLGVINEEGPLFELHKHFWDGYDKQIILNANLKKEEKVNFELLKSEIRKYFRDHIIESRDIEIRDVIDVSEIFTMLFPLLEEFSENKVEIFISPGTPAMQTVWYLLGTHFKKNTTLFKLRDKQYTADKLKPEKVVVSLDTSLLPSNIIVAQKTVEQAKTADRILKTSSLEPIYEMARMIGLTDDVSCLILGENGTGKENLAKYIHDNSARNFKTFKPVNCASISDDLLYSELFGHMKGSFTGATENHRGYFESAEGGTIFLDEIGDISYKMQVSLLRALQEKKITPHGSVNEVKINVRVIAATNKDIESMVHEGEFREDLFYRLAVTTLKLPPLRERGKKDIKEMINHFNEMFAVKFDKPKFIITKEVLDFLVNYGFRGNVRELENIFISLYTFCSNAEIRKTDLPERVLKNNSTSLKLCDMERDHIMKVFKLNGSNILATAMSLDIHRDTLKRKLTEYGLR